MPFSLLRFLFQRHKRSCYCHSHEENRPSEANGFVEKKDLEPESLVFHALSTSGAGLEVIQTNCSPMCTFLCMSQLFWGHAWSSLASRDPFPETRLSGWAWSMLHTVPMVGKAQGGPHEYWSVYFEKVQGWWHLMQEEFCSESIVLLPSRLD